MEEGTCKDKERERDCLMKEMKLITWTLMERDAIANKKYLEKLNYKVIIKKARIGFNIYGKKLKEVI